MPTSGSWCAIWTVSSYLSGPAPLLFSVPENLTAARERELAELRAAHQGVTGVRTVAVTGVAGIGKTSLCMAFAAETVAAGGLVLAGSCPRPMGVPVAYAPFVTAWQGVPGGFVELLNGLAALGPVADEVATAWVCDRVLARLTEWCAERPAVLIVEDAHWIDPASLAVLQAIGRARGPRLLLVVSARTDDARPDLVAGLLELATDHLALAPLPDDAIGGLVRSVLGPTATDEDVAAITRRAQGHPLYAKELARHHGAGLPDTLRVLLARRIRGSGVDGVRLLAAVALAGDLATEPLLAEVLELPPDRVAALVDSAIHCGLLGRDGVIVAPRHGLYTEAAEAELPAAALVDLHRRIALALARSGSDRPGALAWHWERAGRTAEAARCWSAAGRAAAGRHAHAEAAHAFERALALCDDDSSYVDTAVAAATALRWSSRPARGAAILRCALARAGDLAMRCRLLHQLWDCLYVAGQRVEAYEVLAEAAALAASLPDSALTARVAIAECSRLMTEARYAEGVRRGRAVVRLAERVGDAEAEAHARCVLGVCLAFDGSVGDGVGALAAARELAHRCGSVRELTRVAGNLTFVLVNTGQHERCARVAREELSRLDGLGLAHALGGPLHYNLAVSLAALGRWTELDELATAAEGKLPAGKAARVLLCRAEVTALRGDHEAAGELLDRAGRLVSDALFAAERAIPAAITARVAGRARTAVHTCLRALASTPDGLAGIEGLRLCAEGLGALADLQLGGGRVTRFDDPAATAGSLLTAADRVRRRAPEERAWRLQCEAEAGRLRRSCVDAWAAVVAAWAELNLPYRAAYARTRLAEAMIAARSPARAGDAVQEAYAAAVSLGAAPLCREIERVARRGRLPLLGTPTADVPRLDTLTRRETEVLELLGWGRTNREIAAELVLSERTVGVHVSNILAKLGAGNRVEATRIAREAQPVHT
ncbi:MAG TPA: AAA family ATPase [Actinophytocola sp.]|uniref:helix-turn-helix transcriptional regulator n=1 Tax=Actinophytocola sp. TaxID=1872138 RepID=UPI002DDD7516|nr:AAA family ATPase [Actinophytocola sp.]HEV2778629.1 AAA family ATPase [Actinophytocola sp.]